MVNIMNGVMKWRVELIKRRVNAVDHIFKAVKFYCKR